MSQLFLCLEGGRRPPSQLELDYGTLVPPTLVEEVNTSPPFGRVRQRHSRQRPGLDLVRSAIPTFMGVPGCAQTVRPVQSGYRRTRCSERLDAGTTGDWQILTPVRRVNKRQLPASSILLSWCAIPLTHGHQTQASRRSSRPLSLLVPDRAPFGSARLLWRAGLEPTTTHVHVLLAEPVQAHSTGAADAISSQMRAHWCFKQLARCSVHAQATM